MFFDTDVSDIVLLGTNSITCWGRSANASPRLRTLLGSNPGAWQQKARYREDNGLLISNGAPPNGISACGWYCPLPLRRFAPCVLRWKTLARFLSSAPCRVRIPAYGQQKARHRIGNGLLRFCGAPSGIRTRDIHLERVASLAARRWGQRERV